MRGKHTSLDKDLKLSIAWIEKLPNITKVVLGYSESCRHKYSPGMVRFKQDIAGGIKINGYSGNGVVDIFLKIEPISAREMVKSQIAQKFCNT